MSGIFNVVELAGHRALVTGDGNQQCILDTTERDELRLLIENREVDQMFDEAVDDFFEPLTRAAELHDLRHELLAQQFNQADDPAFSLVLKEAVEGVEGVEEERVVLSHDSVVLRLIDSGQTDRLVWVGNDHIEIVAHNPRETQHARVNHVAFEDMPEDVQNDLVNLIDSLFSGVEQEENEDGDVAPDQEPLPMNDEGINRKVAPAKPDKGINRKVAPAEPEEPAEPAEPAGN